MTLSHFFIFLKGDLLRISSGLEFILGYFGFTNFGVLEFSRIDLTEFGLLYFSGFVRILFSCVLAQIKFSVLNIFFRLRSKLLCLFLFILFYRGYRDFSFLMEPVPFLFLFCFVYSDLSALDSCCEGLGVGSFFRFK